MGGKGVKPHPSRRVQKDLNLKKLKAFLFCSLSLSLFLITTQILLG